MGSDGHHMAMSSIVSGLRSAPIAVVNAPVKSVEMDRPCCEHCRTWTEGCTECGWQCPCKINDSGQAWRDDSTRRAKRWPPTEQKKIKWGRERLRERERERERERKKGYKAVASQPSAEAPDLSRHQVIVCLRH